MLRDEKKINVLVTGGTGFIGSNCIKPLIECGLYNVFVLVRKSSSVPASFKQYSAHRSFHVITDDFVDLYKEDQQQVVVRLHKIIKYNHIEIIVHLAAMMEFYPNDKSKLYRTNVIGTKNILDSLILKNNDNNENEENEDDEEQEQEEESTSASSTTTNNKSKSSIDINKIRFIYCSTTETMGGGIVNGLLRDEKSDCHPNFYYGDTKVEAESVVRSYEERHGIDSIILRFTGVYGKNDDYSLFELMQACSYGLIFFIPSFATGQVMYTHVDDVVQSILLAMKRRRIDQGFRPSSPHPNTYIISPDKGLSYREVIVFVNEKLHRMKPRIVLPAVIVSPLISTLGSLMYIFKKKKFLYKSDTLIRMSEDRLFSNERAKKELGFKPTFTFKQGLNVTLEEYLESERLSYYPVSPLFVFLALFIMFVKFFFTK